MLDQVSFVADFARHNRAFLRRAVRWLSARDVDQFLGIGSDIPAAGNVHETAQGANPHARTVSVDRDPVAVECAHQILNRSDLRERTDVVSADLREPDAVLAAAGGVLDFARPIALLVVATLHFVGSDDRPGEVLARYRRALPAGSYLVLSHLTQGGVPEAMREQGRALERLCAGTPTPGCFRGRQSSPSCSPASSSSSPVWCGRPSGVRTSRCWKARRAPRLSWVSGGRPDRGVTARPRGALSVLCRCGWRSGAAAGKRPSGQLPGEFPDSRR